MAYRILGTCGSLREKSYNLYALKAAGGLMPEGMALEIDATVLYALGRHKNVVTFDDLTVDSPYNTYRYPGLPPGPIANPGLPAIEAALNPASTDYLYYVAKPDGSHAFSRTFEEHLAAIRRYQRRP